MSRPAPKIILEKATQTCLNQILDASGVWAVVYNGRPFTLKSSSIKTFATPKYKKVAFTNKGHAVNLAKKLNAEFSTSLFSVVEVVIEETYVTSKLK